jgi:hypothetical protein
MNADELARLIDHSLTTSKAVEIDGLGVFSLTPSGRVSFEDSNHSRVFVAYATEDSEAADRLYNDLEMHGFAPWLDRRKLLPGQNWPRGIEDAISNSDFFIACLSTVSVRKRGGFQTEIRHALNFSTKIPLDDVFMIPVRLDNCVVPERIQRETQYVDLFPKWEEGFERILRIIKRQTLRAA